MSLENDKIIIFIGNRIVAIQNLEDYQGWENYFEQIKLVIEKVSNLAGEIKIENISLRYLSRFDSPNSVKEYLRIGKIFEPLSDDPKKVNLEYTFSENEITRRINIIQNGRIRKGSEILEGFLFGIDISKNENFPLSDAQVCLEFIDQLHSIERDLFRSLLTENFKNQLFPNPAVE
ncbi:MAG: TIGR04255 family protein [Ignavibacteriales bacterium]|nr:TIGR04255 family protein [Ignavibacteriales bacterium]